MLRGPITVGAIALATSMLGCGPSPTHEVESAGGGSESSGGGETAGTNGGETSGTGASDISAFLVDEIAPRICDSLRGAFVGLPGEGGTSGPASGSDPTVGRWWIRECTADVDGDRLHLAIAGTGWTWVDRESMGFRVRQYLRFDARAAFSAAMEIGYDRPSGIATIWMRPGPEVEAAVEPRGMVTAEATNAMAGMLGGILELTGSSASQRAQQQVADEGSQRLRERFGTGFTVTFARANQQMDFMVGALARGEVPIRPYEPEPEVTWSVNQRMQIWPGGMDVLGPITAGQGQQAIDLDLEEGEGLIVEAICAPDFERYYDQVLQGATATPPAGSRVLELARTGAQRALVPELGCETLLIVQPRPGATVPSRMRARVCPAIAPTATARAAAGASGPTVSGSVSSGSGAPAGRPMRIQITAMTVTPQASTGSRWDTLGGEPDPYVIVVSIPGQREVHRTAPIADRHEVAPMDVWLPGAFHPEDLPLRFSVYDDDYTGDELIGSGDLSAAQLAAPGEVHVELRSSDTVPHPMGTIRLRIQPVQ